MYYYGKLLTLVYLWMLLLVGVTVLFAWVTWIVVRRSEPERAIARLTTVSYVGYVVLCTSILVACLLSGVGYSLPTVLDPPFLTVRFSRSFVMITVLAAGPWFVTCLAVYLVSYAAVQRVRDTDEPLRSAVRRFSASYALRTGIPLFLWFLAESAPAGIAAGIVVGVAYAAIGAVEPFIVELMNETRELDPEERARIEIRGDGVRIAVLETDRRKVASGLAVGILPEH